MRGSPWLSHPCLQAVRSLDSFLELTCNSQTSAINSLPTRNGLSNAPLSQFSGRAVSPSPLLRPLKSTHRVQLPRALLPRRPSFRHCFLSSSHFSEGCPAVCPAVSQALARLRHDRNAREDAGHGGDLRHGGNPGRAGLAWALVGAGRGGARPGPRPPPRHSQPRLRTPGSCHPLAGRVGRAAPSPGRSRGSRNGKRKKSAPSAWQAGPAPPPFPAGPVTDLRLRGREGGGAGGARRGRALGTRPGSRLRGFPWPQQRGLCGGGGGAASRTSSFPERPAAPVPREAGGRRTRPSLDVDYRAARDGKRLIKPRPAGPSHSPPRRPAAPNAGRTQPPGVPGRLRTTPAPDAPRTTPATDRPGTTPAGARLLRAGGRRGWGALGGGMRATWPRRCLRARRS